MNRPPVAGAGAKVRWDAVVDRPRPAPAQPAPAAQAAAGPGQGVVVKVWLYGTLANERIERPLELEIGGDATVASVIPALGRRLGEDFLRQVLDGEGRKFNHCLVFVDGVKLDSLDVLVRRGAASVAVEMILLTVTEGG